MEAIVRDTFGNESRNQIEVTCVDDLPPTVSILQPSPGVSVREGDVVVMRADASDDLGVTKVTFFANGVPVSSQATSPYTSEFLLPDCVQGIDTQLSAEARDSIGQTSRTNIVIECLEDTAPTVTLTAPASGAEFIEGTTVLVTADAEDDVAVDKVEFYVGGVRIATDENAPYTASTTLSEGEDHTPVEVRAVAFDTRNQTSESRLTIIRRDDLPPEVTITSPSENAEFVEGALIAITADVSDDRGVSRVEFLRGDTVLGSDTMPPYQIETRVPAGDAGEQIKYTVRAFDIIEQSTDALLHIRLLDDLVPPTVSIVSPIDGGIINTAPTDLILVLDQMETSSLSTEVDIDGDGENDSIYKAQVMAARRLINTLDPARTKVGIAEADTFGDLAIELTHDYSEIFEYLDEEEDELPNRPSLF